MVLETVTPDDARAMLANLAVHVWPFEPIKARRFEDIMRRGEWDLRPRAITLVDGKLTNGRHRLTALVRVGQPMHLWVSRS